jgi:glycosyltransferase involved in cell wall biosynthesis
MRKQKLLRITTVPISLKYLLRGQLRFMRQHGFEVLAVSADGRERKEVMHHEGISHIVVPMSRKISPFQDLVCLVRLISIIKKYNPAIVHTHTPKAGLLGMMAAFVCRVPLRLHTVAGLPLMETTGLKKKLLIFTEWVTYFCAHRVYPNSAGLKKFIIDHVSGNVSKFNVIGRGSSNGIDASYFIRSKEIDLQAASIRTQYNIDAGTIAFSFVGRIVNDKGIEELLIAFDRLSQSKKVKLILVGLFEDDLDPISEKSRLIMKSNRNVILTGFQNDVRSYIAASDVFVFPSYREGFPNVVMQACCLEVPCIVSDINGCNEIIEHNKTGLIVKPKNADDLFEAMAFLASDDAKRREFAGRSREFVAANYNQEYFWNELLKEYVIHEA